MFIGSNILSGGLFGTPSDPSSNAGTGHHNQPYGGNVLSRGIFGPSTGPLLKSDLRFDYPIDRTGDNLAFRGEPDRSLLNRSQWYEVLYFVNRFAWDNGGGSGDVALRAERLIHRRVPSHLRSHENIEAWLIRNWATPV